MKGWSLIKLFSVFQFSNFLTSCQVAKVCVLHKGFQVLVECFPSILTTVS